jgi:hypothetical protein
MATTTESTDETAAAYDTFDEYLRLALKEYYERGWKSRRANFIAFLWASGQTVAMAKSAVSGEKGLKNMAMGAAGVVALRLALRWALGGPLGILLTAATGASLIAFGIKNQKDISSKMGRMKERIVDEKTRFEEIQSGYRANRYDARERNLMVEGQLKRFLGDIDEI